MDLEEQVLSYQVLSAQIKQLEEEKKLLGQEILAQMTTKQMAFSNCKAYKYTRLSIGLSVEQAKLFNATKIEEQVDKAKIKELYYSGISIEGVKEISYLIVTSSKKDASMDRKIHGGNDGDTESTL